MTIRDQTDVEGLKRVGRAVAAVRDAMLSAIEPGMTTRELDSLGETLLAHYGARSAPRLAYNFPGATCISVNEEAAHGIPGARKIQPGDVSTSMCRRRWRAISPTRAARASLRP